MLSAARTRMDMAPTPGKLGRLYLRLFAPLEAGGDGLRRSWDRFIDWVFIEPAHPLITIGIIAAGLGVGVATYPLNVLPLPFVGWLVLVYLLLRQRAITLRTGQPMWPAAPPGSGTMIHLLRIVFILVAFAALVGLPLLGIAIARAMLGR